MNIVNDRTVESTTCRVPTVFDVNSRGHNALIAPLRSHGEGMTAVLAEPIARESRPATDQSD